MRLVALQEVPLSIFFRASKPQFQILILEGFRYSKIMTQSVSNSSGKKLIRIDVSSDTACPWCFVGKRNLDKAINASKDRFDFEIKWHPFFLNPSAPKEGVNKLQYYREKFGSRTDGIIARMTEVYRGLGLEYNISGLTEFLLECAAKVGVEGAAEFLEDPNNGVKEVNDDLKKYSANITGVPYYVISGKHELSGGQPPEFFLRAFEAAAS
ncbi:uncharacterized protein LOC110603990 isoform X6 [Manihot esculenta]|uniref:uncharacterized protein LOC110603990 isoform X6 n=1 Tax=Manihot esculenta TaxID=3983 RepID=UPI000B5D45C3|nr:uncharacterized protein LOC110603990 isoform X6 [Manihot esculenta]